MSGRAHSQLSLRELPSVGSLLERPEIAASLATVPRSILLTAVRAAIAGARAGGGTVDQTRWPALVAAELGRVSTPSLRRAINATGVVLHTNLGRAPLAPAALEAIQRTASGYSTLEYDTGTGERGSRHAHCVDLLREQTGAEDALVVNNCAAALVLTLNTLAADKPVIISRGELIEIGGSFRIPDIMARSSARLVEIGTTNRTHLLDYRASITEQTAAIVKIHRSNFALSGFTADVPLRELAALAAEKNLPVVFDLGSGLLLNLTPFGFPDEPTAARSIADGADVVLMSGDKLLGGPQAGIVVGRREIVERLRANPLARAVRSDKLTLAALEATLRLYRDPDTVIHTVPILAMLCTPAARLRERCARLSGELNAMGHPAAVVDSHAAVGAGAFPTHEIPSAAVVVEADAQSLSERLRSGDPPVVGRIRDDRLTLDLRSVQEQEDAELLGALNRALTA